MVRRVSHWPLTLLGSASSLFNLFLPVVMSRRLSVSDVGEFKVFFLYLAAIPALSFGMGFTNGTYLWGSDRHNAKSKTQGAFLLALFSGALASLASIAAGFYIGWSPSLILFALACTPAVASAIFEAKLIASGEVRSAAYFSAGFEFFRLSSLLGAVLLGMNAVTLFGIHATISWLKLLASGYRLGLVSPFDSHFIQHRQSLLRYAIPVSGAAIFDLLVLNADRYVLSVLLSVGDFAIYAFGCLMVPPLFVFEQSVNQVLIPKLSATKPGSKKVAALYRRAVEDMTLLLLPCTVGLIALANPLIRFLFTDSYALAATYLQWYALYYALSAVPQDVIARARGTSSWILRTAIVFGIGALAATYIGARFFGALGALQAFILVQTLRRIYAIYYFSRSENCKVSSLFPLKAVSWIFVSSTLAGITAHYVSLQLDRPSHAFLIGGLAFAPIYFGLLFLNPPDSFRRLLKLTVNK